MRKFPKLSKLSNGVILLTLSSLAVKAMGLFFKIPLTSLLGEAGMGYFNSAYTIFTWLYMLSCAGLPTALSVLIAKLPKNKRGHGALTVFGTALLIFTALGAVFCLAMMTASGSIARIMRVERAAHAIFAVAPALLFITQSSALRGYFQGRGMLMPHSVSQLAEAFGKLIFGLAFAYFAISRGFDTEDTAALAAFGVVLGVVFGTVILYIAFLFCKKERELTDDTPRRIIASRLILLSLPITLSSSVMSLAGLIDSFIMTGSLHLTGMSQAETAAVWGNYSSLAMPMFNLPPVLTLPIAYGLLPALSSALAAGDNEKGSELVYDAFKKTAVLAVPCAVGMSVMAEPILKLLFDDGVAERGAFMLTLLAPSSLLLCLLGLFNTVLQASGREKIPLYSMVSGAIVKLAATYLLTPYIGRYATPVSTFLCYMTAVSVSVYFIARIPFFSSVIKPSVFAVPFTAATLAVSSAVVINGKAGILTAVAASVTVYFSIILILYINERKLKNERQNRSVKKERIV